MEKKVLKLWFLRITEYSDRLLNDLDSLDWPDNVKTLQRNWIGKSEGVKIAFKVKSDENVEEKEVLVFTTRLKTIFGVSCIGISGSHALAGKRATAIHPFTDEEVPILTENVLDEYGFGAIMEVPAHDSRDKEFALQRNLPTSVFGNVFINSYKYFINTYKYKCIYKFIKNTFVKTFVFINTS